MKKKEDLIKEVKKLYEYGECYNTFSLRKLVEGAELVKEDVNIEKHRLYERHRWYDTSISIFRCSDGLLGIRLPSKLYYEPSGWSSICSGVKFYDVEEVMEGVYITKSIKL